MEREIEKINSILEYDTPDVEKVLLRFEGIQSWRILNYQTMKYDEIERNFRVFEFHG